MRKPVLSLLVLLPLVLSSCNPEASLPPEWPQAEPQMRPMTRWWWLGSAVTEDGIASEIDYLERAGIGGVELTPVYGVQGADSADISYLSPKWMRMLSATLSKGREAGLQVDMNNGTGWPFGGPQVSVEDAAAKAIFQEYSVKGGAEARLEIRCQEPGQEQVARLSRLMAYHQQDRLDITSMVRDGMLEWDAPAIGDDSWRLLALFVGRSFQEVNRAAPGGEGLVMDHFSSTALSHYLERFDRAFSQSGTPFPHSFFNDSYEVYGADWTPELLEEFQRRRGYPLEAYFPEFLDSVSPVRSSLTRRVVSDYRETLSDLLKENFTLGWNDWVHSHGALTRSQAHGSPGNLIDLYAAVDIPECEGFGLSDFGIRGLRRDSLTRKNDCDLSMLKYASSAAHISGKRITSSETFTWLTEHFRTSFSQCKPDLDLMYVSGVNQVLFHGTAYSPTSIPWPGWRFYASVDMSRNNPQFERDMPSMASYITRVQSFMQKGEPDNDFLLYLPIYDIWDSQPGRYIPFEIDHMQERTPEFIDVVNSITSGGYDVDYISDDFILSTTFTDGRLRTSGGTSYSALVIPPTRIMPEKVLEHVVGLAREGADVIFIGRYPQDVPGLGGLEARQGRLREVLRELPLADFRSETAWMMEKGRIITGSDYSRTLALSGVRPEPMKTQLGLQFNRRRDSSGSFYFISCLQPQGVDGWVELSRGASEALIYDPMTGKTGKAAMKNRDGVSRVYLQIPSGGSLILRLLDSPGKASYMEWDYLWEQTGEAVLSQGDWQLSFPESQPEVQETFTMPSPMSWTQLKGLEALRVNMATGLYSATFRVDTSKGQEWVLDLGDVRESAHVRINGKDAGCLWAVPYRMRVGPLLRDGDNLLEVEVTNLPANRISDYDRRGVIWRIFKNINMPNIHYLPSDYRNWAPVPSGLCSQVRLIPCSVSGKGFH